jgi:hypothetical protein
LVGAALGTEAFNDNDSTSESWLAVVVEFAGGEAEVAAVTVGLDGGAAAG